MIAILFISLFNIVIVSTQKTDICDICRNFTQSFYKELNNTHKSNFGGGNTHWEEKNLKSYSNSEIRFVEITEAIYKIDKIAPFLEEHEEKVIVWWNKYKDQELHEYLCIKEKYCCPFGHWGPHCEPCAVKPNSNIPCNGNGKCKGDGTRKGDGSCICNSHASGLLCDQCDPRFYLKTLNSTHVACYECDRACNTCTESGPNHCDSCALGFVFDEFNSTCLDINECLTMPCKGSEYCQNTYGSYQCHACHESCQGCVEKPDLCLTCSPGYSYINNDTETISELPGICLDIDECAHNENACLPDQQCINLPGTFECKSEKDTSLDSQDLGEGLSKEDDEYDNKKAKGHVNNEEL